MPKKAKALSVSIVIPVYNEEDYIGPCLEAIAAQTVKPLEVIIVDNNSTDDTLKIVKNYRFTRVIKEKTQGVLFARNTGFNAAKGDIIGRIDADSRLSANWVETVAEYFARHEDVAAITGPIAYYDFPFAKQNIKIDEFFRSKIYKHFNNLPFLFGTNMAMRSKAWKAVKSEACTRRNIFEDNDLAIHLQAKGFACKYIPTMRGGMSSRRFDDSLIAFYRYIRLYADTYYSHGFRGPMPHISIAIYMFFYVLVWPIHRSYNVKTGQRSIRQLIKGTPARKHPMDRD